MKSFFRDRGLWLAAVVLIMFAISLAQGGVSYTMTFGALRGFLSSDASLLTTILVATRFGFVAALAVLWTLKLKHALFRLITFVNAMFTVALLGHTYALIAVLFGSASVAVHTLVLDVTLMAVSNILIFFSLVLDHRSTGSRRDLTGRRALGFSLSSARKPLTSL